MMDGAVGVVTLAKPPHNLLDDPMMDDLLAAYRAVLAERCRAILLRSSLRHFCAGAELGSFDKTTFIQHDQKRIAEMLGVMEGAPVPTIAVVHGGVLGGGLELALTCDMIVTAETASLGQVEVTVGLLPLLGGTQRLVQRAGLAHAKEIAISRVTGKGSTCYGKQPRGPSIAHPDWVGGANLIIQEVQEHRMPAPLFRGSTKLVSP
jgi:enoyl-CoA hydratase/carnithine racemase